MTSRKEKFKKRERQLWAYLLGYYVDWDFMPTLKEISENAFGGVKLTREGARYILKGLETDGRIKIIKRKRRGIELITKGGETNDG